MSRNPLPAIPRVLIVMGVSGSGKSTLGTQLAQALHAPFVEGDECHPPQNVAKMLAGIALGDEDRWPWLDSLAAKLRFEAQSKKFCVGTCSALKRIYRDRLRNGIGLPVVFLLLQTTVEELTRRVSERRNHYMPVSLLQSQLETLEAPTPDETFLSLDSTHSSSVLMERVREALLQNGVTAPL